MINSSSMRAISVKQPWALLISMGFVDLINRGWSTDEFGPVLIHAARVIDKNSLNGLRNRGFDIPDELLTGGIVGMADLYGCVSSIECRNVWNDRTGYCFLLRGARSLKFGRCQGSPKFFDVTVPERFASAIEEQFRAKQG